MHIDTELLRSPYEHEALRPVTDDAGNNYLQAVESGKRFPIENGITNLLIQGKLEGYNRKYQRFYNLISPLYDSTLSLAAKLIKNSVDKVRMQYMDKLEFHPGGRFLEVSIGTAANIKYLPEDQRCYGIDISRGMLKRARANLSYWQRNVELFLADAEELPFKDHLFDTVLHVGGINAFNNRARAIQEMIRVARPASKIVIVDETAELIRRLSWIPGAKRLLKKYAERFNPPVDLLPAGVTEIETSELLGGGLYCLCFRTPAFVKE